MVDHVALLRARLKESFDDAELLKLFLHVNSDDRRTWGVCLWVRRFEDSAEYGTHRVRWTDWPDVREGTARADLASGHYFQAISRGDQEALSDAVNDFQDRALL